MDPTAYKAALKRLEDNPDNVDCRVAVAQHAESRYLPLMIQAAAKAPFPSLAKFIADSHARLKGAQGYALSVAARMIGYRDLKAWHFADLETLDNDSKSTRVHARLTAFDEALLDSIQARLAARGIKTNKSEATQFAIALAALILAADPGGDESGGE